MLNKLKQFKPSLIALAVLLAAFITPLPARAADWVTNSATSFTQFTNTANNATNTGTSGTAQVIPQNTGVIIYWTTVAAGAGTSNAFVQFNYVGKTGTATTSYPIGLTNSCNGTTNVTSARILSADDLRNVYSLRMDKFGTSQTNAVTGTVRFEWFQ